ncbi:hypothetical protein B0J14DRAFT_583906 [Halenospora varia]|nr:hypothetical protein B0J14DRAFT_583906 [Halenospora varia]
MSYPRKNTSLRTYSRRVHNNSAAPTSKRKRVEESSDLENRDPAVALPLSSDLEETASKKRRADEISVPADLGPTVALPSSPFIGAPTTKRKRLEDISDLEDLDPPVTLPSSSNSEALPSRKRRVHQISISEDSPPIDAPSSPLGKESSIYKRKRVEEVSNTNTSPKTISPFSPSAKDHPITKRQRTEPTTLSEDPISETSLPPPKKIPLSSIQSYFKPLPRPTNALLNTSTASSSRPTSSSSRSSAPSSNHTEHLDSETPPSSPPTNTLALIPHTKFPTKKRPRRLTTRPLLTLSPTMSSRITVTSSSDGPLGDADATRIQPKEQEARHRGCVSSIVSSCTSMFNINHKSGQSSPALSAAEFSQNLLADVAHEKTPKASSVFTPSAPIDIPTTKKVAPYATYSQTVIDLGQASAMRVCTECKMHYNSAIASERRAHAEFCDDMRMPLLTNAMIKRADFVVEIIKDGQIHRVRVVSSSCLRAEQQQAEKILRHTYNELAGVGYSSSELWTHPGQFKIYIYYVDNTPVGVLLVGVKEGRQPMVTFERLWIARQHRRHGLASRLADAARSDFVGYAAVAKEGVEMVEPTEMGRAFARGYGIV